MQNALNSQQKNYMCVKFNKLQAKNIHASPERSLSMLKLSIIQFENVPDFSTQEVYER